MGPSLNNSVPYSVRCFQGGRIVVQKRLTMSFDGSVSRNIDTWYEFGGEDRLGFQFQLALKHRTNILGHHFKKYKRSIILIFEPILSTSVECLLDLHDANGNVTKSRGTPLSIDAAVYKIYLIHPHHVSSSSFSIFQEKQR